MNNETQYLESLLSDTTAALVKQLLKQYPAGINCIYPCMRKRFERPLIEAVLKHTNGNQSEAAKTLGMNRGTFRKKMKALTEQKTCDGF